MSTTDTLCFADYDPVTGAPTLDGFTGIDDAGVITTESEPGYVLGSRLTYSNGSSYPPVIFQGVKNGATLNLAFFCRFDLSFDTFDAIVIAIKPAANSPQDQARRIDIFPNWNLKGADENNGVGGPANTPDDNPPGVPLGDNFYIRTNHNPQDVVYYVGQTGATPWTTLVDGSLYKPTGVAIRVRSWQPSVPPGTPTECAWSVEVQIPLGAATDWINIPDSFALYFNVIRAAQTDAGGPPTGGHFATQFKFPTTSADLTGILDETISIPAYGKGLVPALQSPPGSNLGLGVSFVNGELGAGVRRTTAAPWSALGSTIFNAGDPFPGDNLLVAQVQNTAATAARDAVGVTATFRFANWGLGPAGLANWQPPAGASPVPSTPVNIPHGGQQELTCTWPKASVPVAYNAVPHQCMYVQLDSASAVNFTQSSVRRNMDFVTLSDFERPAHVSGVGYAPPKNGKSHHDFLLFVNVRELKTVSRRPPSAGGVELRSATAGATKSAPIYWIWILSGYRRTGDTLTIRNQPFENLDEAPGAFGFVFNHDGADDSLQHHLTGAGLRKLNDSIYELKVPHDGEVVINTKFKTVPPKAPPQPQPPPDWRLWLWVLIAFLLGLFLGSKL